MADRNYSISHVERRPSFRRGTTRASKTLLIINVFHKNWFSQGTLRMLQDQAVLML